MADAIVGEGDVFEPDLSLNGIELNRFFDLVDLGFGIDDFENAVSGTDGAVHHAGDLTDNLERVEKEAHVEEESDKRSKGERVAPNAEDTDESHPPNGEGNHVKEEHEDGPEGGPGLVDSVEGFESAGVAGVEAGFLPILLTEGFDDPHAGDGVRENGGDVRPISPSFEEPFVNDLAVEVVGGEEERDGEGHDETELPIHRDEDNTETEQHEDGEGSFDHAEGEEFPETVRVRADPGDQAAGLFFGKEAEAEFLHVGIDLLPEIVSDLLAEECHFSQANPHAEFADEVEKPEHNNDSDGSPDDGIGTNGSLLNRLDDIIQKIFGDGGRHEIEERHEDGGDRSDDDFFAVRFEIAEKAPDDGHLIFGDA